MYTRLSANLTRLADGFLEYWYRRDQIVQLTNIIEDFPAGEEEAMTFYNSRVAWVKEMQDVSPG